MPVAHLHLPAHVEERRFAFIDGFKRLGFQVQFGSPPPTQPLKPEDVVVVWNMTARSHQAIYAAQAAGAALIVAENGYFGQDADGCQTYALALDGHNGSGRWPSGGRERLEALNVPFKPLKPYVRDRILIADQRGIGSQLMRSPHNFGHLTASWLERRGFRTELRPHPGRHAPRRPLADDLAQTDAVVVWSSNVATQALIEGLPTYFCAPHIVSEGASRKVSVAHPEPTGVCSEEQRDAAFVRMAWAQWFLNEIAAGEAFKRLLDLHRSGA